MGVAKKVVYEAAYASFPRTSKHLVKERYNLTGARWKRDNIRFVLALRLSIFNEEWDEDWRETRKAA